MAITASAITPDKSLEEFRVEFNKLIQDFDGVASGNTFDQSIIFEGATADAFETTLLVTDPTADRTLTLPNVTGTVITTGNSNAGTTTSSSGDADFVLVDDGGVLKKITPSNLGIGGSAGSVAADDIATGDAAVTIATSTGNITIDAQAGDADIIFKGTDDSSDITALTLDMSDAGKAIFNSAITSGALITSGAGLVIADAGTIGSASDADAIAIGSDGDVTLTQDLELQHDGAILSFGGNDEVSLTHVHDTGLLLNSTMKIQFNDASQFIHGSSNAILSIGATDEIDLTATLVDINANVEISGTLAQADAITMATNKKIIFRDAAIHISSTADGDLSIAADDEIDLTSTLIDINGNVEISGTATTTGVHTFTAVPVFPADTVETADIQDNAVTPAKIAGATNAQTGTSYTFVIGDAFKTVTSSNGSAQTITIPPNSSVAFAVGDRIDVVMLGSGTTTVTGGSGVTVNGVSTGSGAIAAQFAAVSCLKLATDTWLLMGNHGGVS